MLVVQGAGLGSIDYDNVLDDGRVVGGGSNQISCGREHIGPLGNVASKWYLALTMAMGCCLSC